MSFPQGDRFWDETAAFLAAHLAPADRLLAPAPFRHPFPQAVPPEGARGRLAEGFDWSVIHKGEMERLPRALLAGLPRVATPVFANDVFVVWAAAPPPGLPGQDGSEHVRAYHAILAALPPEAEAPPPVAAAAPPAWTPAPEQEAGARELSSRWWAAMGGAPGGARARAFREETARLVADALAPAAGERVLEIGDANLAAALTGAEAVIAVPELLPGAHPDAGFDTVILPDLQADPAALLPEAARLLRAGGRLLLTAPNRDSLALRALRRLGLPLPGPAFSLAQVTGALRAAGLHALRLDGIMLSPGWALPGVDRGLGPLEDDPEFLEAARLLGRRAGPDYALAFGVVARKE